jgi:hypothetical protein
LAGLGALLAGVVAAGIWLLLAPTATQASQFTWQPAAHVPGAVDVTGPRSDGRLVVATTQAGLSLFDGASLTPFARGSRGYVPSGGEAYIAVTPKVRLRKSRCSFNRDDVFALSPGDARIIRIRRLGTSSTFASLPAGVFLSGITFDRVGTFGHRLLVSAVTGPVATTGVTSLYAIDCRGRVRLVAAPGPAVEGGIAVAPRSFGRFGGRLIAVDEHSGKVYAAKRGGGWRTIAIPPLPAGGDIGVESLGFVPPHLSRRRGAAYLADLGAPGAPTVGTDSILRVGSGSILDAGVRGGDLLVATEGGAETVSIRCRKKGCSVRVVGTGPDATHAEGHITFRRP